jgi:hypothetical protein
MFLSQYLVCPCLTDLISSAYKKDKFVNTTGDVNAQASRGPSVPRSKQAMPRVRLDQKQERELWKTFSEGILSPGVKRGQSVMLTTHRHLVPRSWMSRSYTFSLPPPTSPSMACSGTALLFKGGKKVVLPSHELCYELPSRDWLGDV